jgi:hypothetical protein
MMPLQTRPGQFDPAVFWANTTIMLRFQLYTVVARSYLSAMLHEATCECTFSYTGRVLTKERQTIDAEQVCASALCVAGEAVYEMCPNEIKKHYLSKRKRKVGEECVFHRAHPRIAESRTSK